MRGVAILALCPLPTISQGGAHARTSQYTSFNNARRARTAHGHCRALPQSYTRKSACGSNLGATLLYTFFALRIYKLTTAKLVPDSFLRRCPNGGWSVEAVSPVQMHFRKWLQWDSLQWVSSGGIYTVMLKLTHLFVKLISAAQKKTGKRKLLLRQVSNFDIYLMFSYSISILLRYYLKRMIQFTYQEAHFWWQNLHMVYVLHYNRKT